MKLYLKKIRLNIKKLSFVFILIFSFTMIQAQSEYREIKNSLLEFIPPDGFKEKNESYIDTVSQSSFSFVVIPGVPKNSGSNYEDALKVQGFKIIEQYSIDCEVDTSDFFLIQNTYMPDYLSTELLGMFYDGENLIMMNANFKNNIYIKQAISDMLKSFSSMKVINQ